MTRFFLILTGLVLLCGVTRADDIKNMVVIELFTSQGCSSCPPADEALSRIGNDAALKGIVFPLAYHVDYWNDLGWVDPFSHPFWTQRQQRYNRVWRNNRIYTPQLVVDGLYQCVGSDEKLAREQINLASLSDDKVTFSLGVKISGEAPERKVEITVESSLHLENPAGEYALLAAIFEDGLETIVPRGENANRTLRNDHVVRRILRGEDISSKTSTDRQTLTTELPPEWKESNSGVVVFLQDTKTMVIRGGAVKYFDELTRSTVVVP